MPEAKTIITIVLVVLLVFWGIVFLYHAQHTSEIKDGEWDTVAKCEDNSVPTYTCRDGKVATVETHKSRRNYFYFGLVSEAFLVVALGALIFVVLKG